MASALQLATLNRTAAHLVCGCKEWPHQLQLSEEVPTVNQPIALGIHWLTGRQGALEGARLTKVIGLSLLPTLSPVLRAP
jgi:hypothetical protein